ncbi:MAG: hypothetical protein NTY07_05630 [Bacteroidia bacterium]|nr:hypothetical protein [Bacteroidia bacterium]
MSILNKKNTALIGILILLCVQPIYAGPPFNTDDPQPVDFKHWEYYISSINTFQSRAWSGTSPHFEVNYGLVPNVQIHLLLPINYNYSRHQGADFGYTNTEFGLKYRFIQETKNTPQIGTFPIVEIPTIRNSEFSNGKAQIYIPVWAQKSWGKLTTYGGIGYWINPGTDNKNWIFSGWEIQYDISSIVTLGGELYYHSADTLDHKSVTAFNFGGMINASQKTHFIFSLGHSLKNESFFTSYVGLQWTI